MAEHTGEPHIEVDDFVGPPISSVRRHGSRRCPLCTALWGVLYREVLPVDLARTFAIGQRQGITR